MHLPDNVNVIENDESADEQVSENLDSCIERSFLSHRQCRLINQKLRNSDSCLEEHISAMMHGNNSDGRVCVFLKSAQHVILPRPIPSDKDFVTSLQPTVDLS